MSTAQTTERGDIAAETVAGLHRVRVNGQLIVRGVERAAVDEDGVGRAVWTAYRGPRWSVNVFTAGPAFR